MIIKNRLDYALDYVPKCEKLLDIGCDYGDFSKEYLKKAKKVYAVDPNSNTIKEGINRNKGVIFKCAPAEKLPFPDSYFDVITMTDAFEHVLDEKKTINEIYRVLKKDGTLIFSVPYKGMFRFIDSFNLKFYFPKLYILWKGKEFADRIMKTEKWHRHYNLSEIEFFYKNKFTIEKKHRGGLLLNPILWLIGDAIYTDILKGKVPNGLLKVHNFISNLDYILPYGIFAYHIVLKARKI